MLLEKVKEYGIDLYILIVDTMKNRYKAEPFKYHADYNSYQLIFKFEDWSGIIGDGKEHIQTIAEYVNADNSVLCKWQSENFDKLLKMVKNWNDTHRIEENNHQNQ